MLTRTKLWRRLDRPGLEIVRLIDEERGWRLAGDVIVADGDRACRFLYEIACDRSWTTLNAKVEGWIGERDIRLVIGVDEQRRWTINGDRCAPADGCIYIDLAFSPSTNTLPIRRSGLSPGGVASVRAAWLRFPELDLVPLEQTYRCLDIARYRYESAGGRFVGEIEVDDAGLVTRYAEVWETLIGDLGS